jgi:alanyl-tRNA synthetase
MTTKPSSEKVRADFIGYFEKQGHQPVASSRLVPENDPTLLFNNAGMNQFKNLFLGGEKRSYSRAATSQKCVRAGGKHNDLENVGYTARHHTFFEMLGNFSFGDYFKKDAIHFAWELITKEFGIPKDRLYVSVFQNDDDAADLWHKQEGVPKDRIYRFGEKDNFWRMGDTGPCGPCSEIFVDLGPEVGGDPKENVMGGNGDRFMEIWNLVFMQFEEDGTGQKPLPRPSIDTGMGLERLTAVLQGELSNYHTDLFQDIIGVGAKVSGHAYMKSLKELSPKEFHKQEKINVALRVLADHSRAAAFLIADGVLPSNEGRGYVLRRIMRRALRFGRELKPDGSIYPQTVAAVIKKMSAQYRELDMQKALIEKTIVDEETRFLATLDQGTNLLRAELDTLKKKNQQTLPGETLFKLYDTYGFPADLTRLMAKEEGFQVDELGFEKQFAQAREKAKASWKGKNFSGDAGFVAKWSSELAKKNGVTRFVGYETTQAKGQLLALSNGTAEVAQLKDGDTGILVFNETPFYAEGGGQVGDKGVIHGSQGQAEVIDCTKHHDVFLHHVRVVDGILKKSDLCDLKVESPERRNTANNHSATHLLHSALRTVLGPHVTQAGSLVDSDRLRFDFTHSKPLSPDETLRIEELVNAEVGKSVQVETKVMAQKAAIDAGALALFGEKYGDEVRVVRMGDFSTELCGGTHVSNTAQIRLFKVVGESGVSSGVRRIEAITGEKASEYIMKLAREALEARNKIGAAASWTAYLETPSTAHGLSEWIDSANAKFKTAQREMQSLKGQNVDVDAILTTAKPFEKGRSKGRFVFADLAVDDRQVLSDLADKLRDKLQDAVVVVLGQGSGSHPIVVTVSKSLNPELSAGKILGEIAQVLGGKGGGRPDFAQGAAPDRSQLSAAQAKLQSLLV